MQHQRARTDWFLMGLFLLTLCVGLSSCTMITQEDFLALNDRVVSLNARVDRLQSAIDKRLSQDVDSKIEPIRASQAEMVAELDKVKEQIQSLSGRVEENSLLIRRSVEKDTTSQDVMKAELAELKKRIEALEGQVMALQGKAELEKKGQEGAPQRAQGVETGPVQQPSTAAQPSVVTEKDLYEQATALFKQGRYEDAIAGFMQFLKQYPSSDLADNAQFWIGESYMRMGQYEKAILAFQKVIKKYPDGNKVPGAMLKQALAFSEIKDKVSARLLLKKVIRKYPESEEAKIARAKLKAIK